MKLPSLITIALVATLSLGVGTTLAQTAASTPTPAPKSTRAPRATARPRATRVPRPTRTPRATATPVATAVPASALSLTYDKIGYDRWGRPAGMDGSGGCRSFNDSRPVLRLEVSMQLTNGTNQVIPSDEYWVEFFKTDGSRALTCVWLYESSTDIPSFQPGQTINLTFMGFMEPNERIAAVRFVTENAGSSPKVAIPQDLKVP